RPEPRPANTVAWARTEAIEQALDRILASPGRPLREGERLMILQRMLREGVPAQGATLGRWLEEEREPDTVAVLLAALRGRPGGETLPHLEAVLRNRKQTKANRLLAATLFLQGLDAQSEERLSIVAAAIEDGPVLAELLRAIG